MSKHVSELVELELKLVLAHISSSKEFTSFSNCTSPLSSSNLRLSYDKYTINYSQNDKQNANMIYLRIVSAIANLERS